MSRKYIVKFSRCDQRLYLFFFGYEFGKSSCSDLAKKRTLYEVPQANSKVEKNITKKK